MPEQPPDPLMTASLISQIKVCTWSADYLLDASGNIKYLGTTGSGPATWDLAASGAEIVQRAYALLYATTSVNMDGSFISGGVRYKLSLTYDWIGLPWATPVVYTP